MFVMDASSVTEMFSVTNEGIRNRYFGNVSSKGSISNRTLLDESSNYIIFPSLPGEGFPTK
jgi:hypothetical protein